MENEYNDYQIMSPGLMESIAKKYQEALNEKHAETKNDYSKLTGLLKEAIIKNGTLKNVCSKKFFMGKRIVIEEIDKRLRDMLLKFSDEKIDECNNSRISYCTLVKDIINLLTETIKECMKNLNHDKSLDLEKCTLTCLTLIKDVTGLIGECRYRTLF